MSEKTDVDQDYDDGEEHTSAGELPEYQYSRAKLLDISKSKAACARPKCLEKAYDSEDGKWDPDRWYKAKFGQSREASPLTLVDGKDRRRVPDLDRDIKRRPSINDPVERLKEEKDGIVLSPQRRSFGTGCHVQTPAYLHQLSLPEREREETKVERDRDRDRERERPPARRIGSGRIQIDRENSRDFSGLRDRFDDRDREYTWNRDRDVRDRDWDRDRDVRDRDRDVRDRDRDVRDRDRDARDRDRDLRDGDWDRDKDRRFERSDRFRRASDREFPERDRRERDFRDRGDRVDRDRGFDRSGPRRKPYGRDEKEPEWFTGGPTSQNDTIELRGFEREKEEHDRDDSDSVFKNDVKKQSSPTEEKSGKESSEEASEVDIKTSQRSSPEDQQMLPVSEPEKSQLENQPSAPQPRSRTSPTNHKFDIEQILKADFQLDEDVITHGSRFSRFFVANGNGVMSSDASSIEDMLVPHDLLEDSHSSPTVPSPIPLIGPMGAMHGYLGLPQHGMHHYQEQFAGHMKDHLGPIPHNLLTMPNPAGDNNATVNEKMALPPSVTALFNSAAVGGSNACKWKPRLDCSVETLESSYYTDSAMSSTSSFSTQDSEAQLKAMLFRGPKESASSSGTASPATLPPSVQHKVKTVAELEADMHQNSAQKTVSPVIGSVNQGGDMSAFNKLLILINAGSEATHNAVNSDSQSSRPGLLPSHSEFNHAVMRNKEEQMQLLQRSLQNVPPGQQYLTHQALLATSSQQQGQTQAPTQVTIAQQFQKQQLYRQQQVAMQQAKQMGMVLKPPTTPGLPQAMSTPMTNIGVKPRAQSGGPTASSDPIYSLIQQNPTIVMKPASPAPLAALLASQQTAVPSTARVPSPLMFSQQPPLHLSAPSPIHPGQLSPRSLTVAGSTMSSPSGLRSPVLPRVLSPQELSAHAQAVMQSALIKKQLQDQNERYMKKQQERAKSPNQPILSVVKPQPAAQPILPPTPQPKGTSVDTFTPTSVLRKMHCDKAIEKEKQAHENKSETETGFMPSMHELSGVNYNDSLESNDSAVRKAEAKLVGDLSDISFLDPVNPNLVAMSNQLENLRMGQSNVLPGTLSQPMSVEEKMKLSDLAEKPGYLSLMLDKAARANQGRPIVKASPEITTDDRSMLQLHLQTLQQQHQQLMQQPPPANWTGRPVTGSSTQQPSFMAPQTSVAPPSPLQQTNKLGSGRAIVGGNSVQQQGSGPQTVNNAQSMEFLRMFEQQQQLQRRHGSHTQGLNLPPPPMGPPLTHMGPPPGVGVHVTGRFPVVSTPVHSTANAVYMNQQLNRANAQRHQQFQMAMQNKTAQQQQQPRVMTPIYNMVPGPLSPHSPAGPLSPAALNATLQRVASPHGIKMNGPLQSNFNMNGGGGKGDIGGIQRWFSSDILKTQLPSMPPLPTQGSHVMTVDELERN
uniref:Eukaryotic translation initiation factor 4E transporter n=1 Tax=Biomphalaria glabrata TaxID=6526 RepID=A0A2C9KJI6_BIOGL